MRRLLGKHGFRTRWGHSINIYLITTKCQPFRCSVTTDSGHLVHLSPQWQYAWAWCQSPSGAWQNTRASLCGSYLYGWPTPTWTTSSFLSAKSNPAALCSDALNWFQISVLRRDLLSQICLCDCFNSDNAVCGRGLRDAFMLFERENLLPSTIKKRIKYVLQSAFLSVLASASYSVTARNVHASQTESDQARRAFPDGHVQRVTHRGQSPKQSPAFTELTSRLERFALSQQRAAWTAELGLQVHRQRKDEVWAQWSPVPTSTSNARAEQYDNWGPYIEQCF